jgi:hypothetical protein
MGHHPRSQRTGLRRAVVGSVVIHVAAAVVGILLIQSRQPATRASGTVVDTHADAVTVRLFPEEVAVAGPVAIEQPRAEPPQPEPPPPEPPASPPPAATADTTGARPPLANVVPQPLSTDVMEFIRRPRNPVTDPNVRPAAALAAPPLHGAMKPGQTIVYALDCSGSMGEFGKFAAARDALVATLRRQPGQVRFQVICYNSTARAVLPGGCVAATAAYIAAAEAGLATLSPSGRSNHAEAVRTAANLRPDVILLLTDAQDLSAAKLRPAPAGAGTPVWVARVAADRVGPPGELR